MRTMLNLALAIALAYGLILTFIFFFQSRLVYFPNVQRELVATPRAAALEYEDVELRTSDGVKIHGWWVPARAPRGAVLIFHGNAGNISHRIEYLQMFNQMHYAVLIIDYRGYGKSEGAPSEEGTYRDAEAAWQYLIATREVPARDIVVFGESLGGGVALWLAEKYPPRALVLASTFTSVPDMGAGIYPWLPVRLLARIRYENLQRIASIKAPILIAHSREDEIVPYRHAEALYKAAPQPKELLQLKGGHNEGFLFAHTAWVAAVGAFLDRAAQQR